MNSQLAAGMTDMPRTSTRMGVAADGPARSSWRIAQQYRACACQCRSPGLASVWHSILGLPGAQAGWQGAGSQLVVTAVSGILGRLNTMPGWAHGRLAGAKSGQSAHARV